MMKTLKIAWTFVRSPAEAAAGCRGDDALAEAAKIYGLTLLAAALYFRFKPYDFPDANAAVPGEPQTLAFWLGVMLWQPLLMAALIGFAGVLLRWMKDGWLPVKVATAFLWTALPLILAVAYVKNSLPKAAFGALMLVWAAPGAWAARDVPAREWRALAAFLLGLNAIELASFVPQAAVTVARWEAGYKGIVALAGLWMLFGGALGLRELTKRPLPRALLPLLFALALQIVVVADAFLLGWLPKESLKALLYG